MPLNRVPRPRHLLPAQALAALKLRSATKAALALGRSLVQDCIQ
jgi:hypothetical protein